MRYHVFELWNCVDVPITFKMWQTGRVSEFFVYVCVSVRTSTPWEAEFLFKKLCNIFIQYDVMWHRFTAAYTQSKGHSIYIVAQLPFQNSSLSVTKMKIHENHMLLYLLWANTYYTTYTISVITLIVCNISCVIALLCENTYCVYNIVNVITLIMYQ